jgi:hypothetical protein
MKFTHILDKSIPRNIEYFNERINQLDITRRWNIEVKEYKSQRSLQQNRWARKFASEFGKHIGYEPDEAYDLLMYKCNPIFKTDPSTGEQIRLNGHFSKLDTKEAAEVQEAMIRFCGALGFYFNEER